MPRILNPIGHRSGRWISGIITSNHILCWNKNSNVMTPEVIHRFLCWWVHSMAAEHHASQPTVSSIMMLMARAKEMEIKRDIMSEWNGEIWAIWWMLKGHTRIILMKIIKYHKFMLWVACFLFILFPYSHRCAIPFVSGLHIFVYPCTKIRWCGFRFGHMIKGRKK